VPDPSLVSGELPRNPGANDARLNRVRRRSDNAGSAGRTSRAVDVPLVSVNRANGNIVGADVERAAAHVQGRWNWNVTARANGSSVPAFTFVLPAVGVGRAEGDGARPRLGE